MPSYLCKLEHAGDIVDDNCLCAFDYIRRENPFSDRIIGRGNIKTIKPLPIGLLDLGVKQFYLKVDPPLPFQGVGMVGRIPIILTEVDLSSKFSAVFEIKRIVG